MMNTLISYFYDLLPVLLSGVSTFLLGLVVFWFIKKAAKKNK